MSESDKYPYSPLFQERILGCLVQDASVFGRFHGVWSHRYFRDNKLKVISQSYFQFRSKYNHNPDIDTLINEVILGQDATSDEYKRELVEVIGRLYNNEIVDKDAILDKVVHWAKDNALEDAIIRGVEKLNSGDRESIRVLMDEAYRVGSDLNNIGLIVDGGMDSVSDMIKGTIQSKIPTGFSDVDLCIGGGVGGGELFVFVGPPKGFKSGNLLNTALPALGTTQGKNVTYVSLELSQAKVLERFSYRITRMTQKQMLADSILFDKTYNESVSQKMSGQLAIKNYANRTMTSDHLRAYLDLLESNKHTTDLLIVDYGNIMKPKNSFSSEWTQIGSNFEELRAIAIDRNIPVITACRTNRESLNKDDVRLEHIAGSMEISATCDYAVALCQTSEEHKEWKMRHKVLLNRNEESDIMIGCDIDYPTYTIWNTGVIVREESDGDEGLDKGLSHTKQFETKAARLPEGSKINQDTMAKLRNIIDKSKQ